MARIGIDLGTTNTVVAMVYDDGPHVIPRGQGRPIPSVVAFRPENTDDPLVGEVAADRYQGGGPVVRSIKRLMGRTCQEAASEKSEKYFPRRSGVELTGGEGNVGLSVAIGHTVQVLWPPEISAHILRHAKKQAERALGTSEIAAAITVPAYFDDPHRRATLDAARLAGVDVCGALVDEPQAAAIAFAPHLGLRDREPILVADWGGGTLDLTVLVSEGRNWLQLNIDGHLTLGGDDIDRELMRHIVSRAALPDELLQHAAIRWELIKAAREAKEKLSSRDEAVINCPGLVDPETGRRWRLSNVTLTRSEFDAVCSEKLAVARERVVRCLSHRDVVPEDVKKVLLVGGSSRMPAFRSMLQQQLPWAQLHDDVSPMDAVALGAAIVANDTRSAEPPEKNALCPYGYAFVDEAGAREQVIPARAETPTPDWARYGIKAATRYNAQTIYRLKLESFEIDRRGRAQYYEERRQVLYARDLPPRGAGHPVDIGVWLDESKIVRAECHISGLDRSFPLETRDCRDRLFAELFDAQLDAEAVIAANQATEDGLLGELRRAVALAKVSDAEGDREKAAAALAALLEVAEQLDARRVDIETDALGTTEQRVRSRVAGWLDYYEREIFGRFADLMDDEQREAVVQAIRTLRLRLATAASAELLEESLIEVDDALFVGPARPALLAWRRAVTLGVAPRFKERLRLGATALIAALRAEDEGLTAQRTAELEGLLAESALAWRKWSETEGVLDGGADLILPRKGATRGN